MTHSSLFLLLILSLLPYFTPLSSHLLLLSPPSPTVSHSHINPPYFSHSSPALIFPTHSVLLFPTLLTFSFFLSLTFTALPFAYLFLAPHGLLVILPRPIPSLILPALPHGFLLHLFLSLALPLYLPFTSFHLISIYFSFSPFR